MLNRVLVRRLLPTLVACACVVGAVSIALRSDAAAAGGELLPDLDQATPDQLVITRTRRRDRPAYLLGFRSAVSNVGDGPLIITGRRPVAGARTMVAEQHIATRHGPDVTVPDAGRLRYVVSPDHRHWHLLGFDRYELRRDGGGRLAADRKSGFCLGDRYRYQGPAPAAAARRPRYTSRCGLDHPEFLSITEGISVGYGDDYRANLEGQYLPLTGLRAGRYVLVHRANADRRLREIDYSNNAASLLLGLRWRRGQPWIRVLRSCPRTDRCDSGTP